MGLRAAAHAVGEQEVQHPAGLHRGQLVAAQLLSLLGAQGRGHPIAHGDGGLLRRGVGCCRQQIPHLGVLLLSLTAGAAQLAMILAAQEEKPQFLVDGGDKLPQMDAPGGEVQGEILRLGRATAQQRRTGIIEGVVGGVIVLLPAVGAQDAGAAHLLRRPVEDHRGILRRGRGRVPEEAVVQGAQSRSGLLQPAGLCRLSGCIRPGGTLCAGRQPAPGQQQIGRTARQT